MTSIAVCKTGPLIAFSKLGKASLLDSLFTRVLIPRAVRDEFDAGVGKELNPTFPLNALVEGPRAEPDPLLVAQLDIGEASVIQLALENPGAEALLDERKARRIAMDIYGLPVIGAGGLLLRAKRRGLLPTVKPLLEELRSKGYFLSNNLTRAIIKAAGE